MKYLWTLLFLLPALSAQASMEWLTDYDSSYKEAQRTGKELVIVVTDVTNGGKDFVPSAHLERELTGGGFVCVKLDIASTVEAPVNEPDVGSRSPWVMPRAEQKQKPGVSLLDHPAFADLTHRPGIILMDFSDSPKVLAEVPSDFLDHERDVSALLQIPRESSSDYSQGLMFWALKNKNPSWAKDAEWSVKLAKKASGYLVKDAPPVTSWGYTAVGGLGKSSSRAEASLKFVDELKPTPQTHPMTQYGCSLVTSNSDWKGVCLFE